MRAALNALARLERDARLNGTIQFDGRNIELLINDRLLAPTNEETRKAAEPELLSFLDFVAGGSEYSVQYETEPRKLFGARIQLKREFSTKGLLDNVNQDASQHAGL